MQKILQEAKANFENSHEIVIDVPKTLTEISKLKSLGGNFQSVLTTLFMPFLSKTLEFTFNVHSCNVEKFKNRLHIDTNLLSHNTIQHVRVNAVKVGIKKFSMYPFVTIF